MFRPLLFVFLFPALFFYQTSAQNLDSLRKAIDSQPEDTNKVDAYYTLCRKFNMAGQYDEALEVIGNSIRLAQKLGSKSGLASAYSAAGITWRNKGNYTEALNNHLKSLRLREELGDKRSIASSYMNLANIYVNQNNNPQALKMIEHVISLREELHDTALLGESYLNLGVIYDNMGDLPRALENYARTLQLYPGQERIEICKAHNNIGNVYIKQKKYPAALAEMNKALKIAEEEESKEAITTCQINLATIYTQLHKYQDAVQSLNIALKFSREMDSKEDLKFCYSNLSALDSAMGNYAAAFADYKMYIKYRDSLNNAEAAKKNVQLQLQYEFDKKESIARAEQEKKDAVTEAEANKQRITIYAVSSGMILLLILAIVILRSLRMNQKQNKIITEQKADVERQKAIVEEKQKEIIDSIHYAKRIQQALITNEKYIQRAIARLKE